MKALLRKLNDLPLFDPGLWPQRELLARFAGVSICIAFLIHRILRFFKYTGALPPFLKSLAGMSGSGAYLQGIHPGSADWHWIMWFAVWVIETGIFLGYILAFVTRRDARSVAKGFMEVVFPVAVAAVPIVITLTPMNFRDVWPPFLERLSSSLSAHHIPGTAWMEPVLRSWEPAFFFFLAIVIFGGMVNLVGLLTLRRAFTIMSEARELIRRGIFSRVRHPLYAGHFVMFFGYLLFHLYWYTCVLYLAFLAGQYVRARIEEAKLMGVFPEYALYRESTGMFFPRLTR